MLLRPQNPLLLLPMPLPDLLAFASSVPPAAPACQLYRHLYRQQQQHPP
jgi:hypothetical protein